MFYSVYKVFIKCLKCFIIFIVYEFPRNAHGRVDSAMTSVMEAGGVETGGQPGVTGVTASTSNTGQ